MTRPVFGSFGGHEFGVGAGLLRDHENEKEKEEDWY